jgi:hypothetical protein
MGNDRDRALLEMLVSSQPITLVTTDGTGSFTAPVTAHTDHGPDPYVVVVRGGDELPLALEPMTLCATGAWSTPVRQRS